jgi:iron uptake system component EfeO
MAIKGTASVAAGGLLAYDRLVPAVARQPEASPAASPVPSGVEAHVDTGLAYFQRRATDQLPLVQALRNAIANGDLESAKEAYVVSRPPYEEIEVLAASFPETDEAIDARPYAFEMGESSPDFKGFHRIEILLYREGDPAAALPVADELIASIETLQRDLTIRDNFSAAGHFAGVIALANEVASKKISSEEETWSDQSMLIFRHNWIGIWSQYEPFAAEVSAIDPSLATAVEATYQEAMALADSAFASGSTAATPYSQVPVETRGRIVAASYALRDGLIGAREVLGLSA